jgi:hypothetical protein
MQGLVLPQEHSSLCSGNYVVLMLEEIADDFSVSKTVPKLKLLIHDII